LRGYRFRMLFYLSCIPRKIFRVGVILKLYSHLLIPGKLVKGALRLDEMVSWMSVTLMSSQGSENQSLFDR
jgi:hypothetical protein